MKQRVSFQQITNVLTLLGWHYQIAGKAAICDTKMIHEHPFLSLMFHFPILLSVNRLGKAAADCSSGGDPVNPVRDLKITLASWLQTCPALAIESILQFFRISE